ncbi:unnamed protein product, partial [Allacma fusca]
AEHIPTWSSFSMHFSGECFNYLVIKLWFGFLKEICHILQAPRLEVILDTVVLGSSQNYLQPSAA